MPFEPLKTSLALRNEREKIFQQMESLKNQIVGLNTSINIAEKSRANKSGRLSFPPKLELPAGVHLVAIRRRLVS